MPFPVEGKEFLLNYVTQICCEVDVMSYRRKLFGNGRKKTRSRREGKGRGFLRWLLNRLLTAAFVLGGALIVSPPGFAHDDRSQHAAMQSKAKSGAPGYATSLRTYATPDVMLTDADGTRIKLRELLAADAPVMMNFIFTTCGAICPVMSKVFSDVPAKLGADAGRLRMISISIDPENDTPAQLKAYAKNYEATARWKFFTGQVDDINRVQRAFDNYRGDKMNHAPLTLLRPAPGKPWVRIEGFASPDELAREYRKVVQK